MCEGVGGMVMDVAQQHDGVFLWYVDLFEKVVLLSKGGGASDGDSGGGGGGATEDSSEVVISSIGSGHKLFVWLRSLK